MKNTWKESRLYHWLIHKKLYHLPLWIAYELFLSVTFSGQIGWNWQSVVGILFYILGHATGSYINIYYLIPRYLNNKQYLRYLVGFLLNIAISPLIILIGFYISFSFNLETLMTFVESKNFIPAVYLSSINTIIGIMAFSLTQSWFASQRRSKELEKERLEAELKFLRSQFNPHFLFNTINSIFFLIHKDQDQASESLSKFSELLRYQLYECNEAFIRLDREIPYLHNFIELEKLRQNPSLEVSFQTEGCEGKQAQIAPFILIPFIENAFKHASKNKNGEYFIHCQLQLEEDLLRFTIENSAAQNDGLKGYNPYSGIGLENVKRRLLLLYPEKHELEVQKTSNTFTVQLLLQL